MSQIFPGNAHNIPAFKITPAELQEIVDGAVALERKRLAQICEALAVNLMRLAGLDKHKAHEVAEHVIRNQGGLSCCNQTKTCSQQGEYCKHRISSDERA